MCLFIRLLGKYFANKTQHLIERSTLQRCSCKFTRPHGNNNANNLLFLAICVLLSAERALARAHFTPHPYIQFCISPGALPCCKFSCALQALSQALILRALSPSFHIRGLVFAKLDVFDPANSEPRHFPNIAM